MSGKKCKSDSDRTLKVFCDSGANAHSCNRDELTLDHLGLDSWEEWDDLSEAEKYKIVADFWSGMGYPEIGWEDE